MRFKFFFRLQKNEGNSDNKNHHDVRKLFLLIMLIVLSLQDNPNSVIKRITCFSQFELFFET